MFIGTTEDTATTTTTVDSTGVNKSEKIEVVEDEEENAKLEEKLIAKAKRKVEKDLIAAEEKREEEGREKRRLEKIRDNEEAKILKEEQARYDFLSWICLQCFSECFFICILLFILF